MTIQQDMGNLTLNVYLNWDLYGHHNAKGFAMLHAAFDKLLANGWVRS